MRTLILLAALACTACAKQPIHCDDTMAVKTPAPDTTEPQPKRHLFGRHSFGWQS